MIWSKLFVGLGITLFLGLLVFWWWPERSIKNFPAKASGPIVFIGDSLVEGVGASFGEDMPTQLSTTLGIPVLNYGVAGDTTEDVLKRVNGALLEKPRLVIVLAGGNDFLQKIERDKTAQNLEYIIGRFQNDGAVVLLLGVRSGILSGGSDEFFETIAEKTEAAYEPDVLKGIFADPSLMSDAIHPNARGYQKIVERITPTVRELLSL